MNQSKSFCTRVVGIFRRWQKGEWGVVQKMCCQLCPHLQCLNMASGLVGTRLFRLFQPRLHGSERQGTVIDFDTNDEQPLVRVVRDGRGSACAISDEDPLIRSQVASIPVPSTIPAEAPLPTWLDGNETQVCQR